MPPPGLMPEMDASLQQLLHSDFWQNSSLFLESNEAGEAQGGTRSTFGAVGRAACVLTGTFGRATSVRKFGRFPPLGATSRPADSPSLQPGISRRSGGSPYPM